MLYAVLCYNDENAVIGVSKEHDDKVMADLIAVQKPYLENGKLGAFARLMPTTAAITLRETTGEPVIIDGPFAETKEQFLGFYVIDCESLEEAIQFVRQLTEANPGTGSYEIRPVGYFTPGGKIE